MRIFAIVAPYQAGSSTLNPACAPGEINCFVEIFPDQSTHSGEFLTTDGVNVSWAPIVGAGGGTVTSVSGTANRITVTSPTTNPIIDISASYVGQSSITTLGTITTGTWNGTAISDTYISSAPIWNAKENALTFGTGLTRSVNTITLNTTQNILKLSNLTTNGFVKTTGGDGTLSVVSFVNLATDVSGNLAVSHLNSGTGASASTFWRGDGTWASIPPASQTLQDVTDLGNTTTNPIISDQGFLALSPSGVGKSIAIFNTDTLKGVSLNTGVSPNISWDEVGFHGVLMADNITASRLWQLPDTDGTLTLSVNGIFADSTGNIVIPGVISLIGSTSTLGTETWLGTSAIDLGTASTNDTVFLGINAGQNATNADESIFLGTDAGNGAVDASYSIFMGNSAGVNAVNAIGAFFAGQEAGNTATNASQSIFLGTQAGDHATNAHDSFFAGIAAARNATKAANSIFIGLNAGNNDTTLDNTGNPDDYSILLGQNTHTGGFSNSIAIGSGAVNTTANQFVIGSTTRPINEFAIRGNNAYINFDSSGLANGVNGYGFRDNNGVMEFKNLFGIWNPIPIIPPYTFGAGLTNTAGTITNNLITGISGNQIAYGSTSAGGLLQLGSTTNATKGQVVLGDGSQGVAIFDETNTRFGIGVTPAHTLDVNGDMNQTGGSVSFSVGGGTNSFSVSTNSYPSRLLKLSNDGTFFIGDGGSSGNGTSVVGDDLNGTLQYTAFTSHTFGGGGSIIFSDLAGGGTQCLSINNAGLVSGTGSACGAGGGTVTSVSGTANRITVTSPTTNPIIDISASYVGQSSITTLGTITTGTWNGTAISDTYISSAPIWNAKENALTFGTGLTRSVNTITNNLSTGVSGGQSVIGGTASGNSLTLSSTSNATKGSILFGNSGYDEANNRLGVGTQTPATTFQVIGTSSFSGGNVGIGTSTPGVALDVVGAINASTDIKTLAVGGSSGLVLGGEIINLNEAGLYSDNSNEILSAYNVVTGAYTYANGTLVRNSLGNISIGGVSGTARLTLPAGSSSANNAPLKFTTGTNLSSPEAGAVEWNGTNLFITQSTGPTRKTIAYTSDITGTNSGTNTGDQTTSGTTNRISVTSGSTNPIIDISASYVGQSSITTLGTITTGTWNAGIIAGQYGGTGVANTGKTITLGGDLVTSGAFSTTLTVGATTNITLPSTGTLATLAGTESLTNKKLGSLTTNGFVKTSGGDGTLSVDTTSYQTALTFSTGITNSSGTITNNLSTGVSGGQSVIGGTASGNSLTLSSTSNATKGSILFGNSGYDEANNTLGIGTTASSTNKVTFADTVLAGSGSLSGSLLNMTQTWSTTASPTAIKLNVTNTGSGAAALLLDLQVGSISQFKVAKDGSVTTNNGAVSLGTGALTTSGNISGNNGLFSTLVRAGSTSGFMISTRSQIKSSADGLLELMNSAGTNFTRLNFGGATSSFPSIKKNGTALNFRLADDSADAAITALSLTAPTIIGGSGTTSTLALRSTSGTGAAGADIIFQTGTNGGTEAMRILNSGFVGIGQTNPGFTLHVGSSSVTDGTTLLRLQDTNSTCDFNANAGAPSCGSDRTLKKDISPLNTADLLTRVSSLNPVSYHWLTEDSASPSQYGFIAQEVAEQFPDLVTDHTWIDGTTRKFLNTGGLMPYAIGAIKELNLKVQGLLSLDTSNASSLGSLIKSFLSSQVVMVQELTTGKLNIDGEVCVDDVCVTKEQFKALLLQAKGIIVTPPPGGGGGGEINPPTPDVCPNIDGGQSSVPSGYHLDETNNCVVDITPPPDQTPIPDPTPVPDPVPTPDPTPTPSQPSNDNSTPPAETPVQ